MGAFEIAILAIAVFLITVICEALWIKFAKARGLVGLDWAKKGRVLLSEGEELQCSLQYGLQSHFCFLAPGISIILHGDCC